MGGFVWPLRALVAAGCRGALRRVEPQRRARYGGCRRRIPHAADAAPAARGRRTGRRGLRQGGGGAGRRCRSRRRLGRWRGGRRAVGALRRGSRGGGRRLGGIACQERLERAMAPQRRLPRLGRARWRLPGRTSPPGLQATVGLALCKVKGTSRGGGLPPDQALPLRRHAAPCAHVRPRSAGAREETEPRGQVDLVHRRPPQRRSRHPWLVR
mmetsp:Transcript_14733/g.31962  ORF Transcript_14733/g.31962 Transcript_14733/m.31962 type:complete len:212 (+) Transcript_14733:1150-1785(+)